MADTVNPDDRERAYREGVVDQKLSEHDAHFREINGSIGRAASALVDVEKTLSRVGDQVQGLTVTMPAIQKLANETATSEETAKHVAAALARKTEADRSTWDRYRGITAWALGVLIAAVTIANFTTRISGFAVKEGPTQTVTVERGGP